MIRLLVLLTTISFAQFKDVDSQALTVKNMLKNSGFENGTSKWSVTAGSLTSSTTSPAFGKSKGLVDFSATGQFLRSASVAIPEGLYGKRCNARFMYKGGGTADIRYRVTDGTTTIAGYTVSSTTYKITAAATLWTDSLEMAFVCPSSGSLTLEFESVGDAVALSVDEAYVGPEYHYSMSNDLTFGGGLNTTDKSIIIKEGYGAASPKITFNQYGYWTFTEDGTNYNTFSKFTNHSGNKERVERLYVSSQCTSDPCTVTTSSGGWYGGVLRITTGRYRVTFNLSLFANSPSCIAMTTSTSGSSPITVRGITLTSSEFEFETRTSASPVDSAFSVICIGEGTY